ncbi:MAG: S24 family peptidase [Alphaproteobacteria bacterium]
MATSHNSTEYQIEPVEGRLGAYALRVLDHTMEPRYFPGGTVCVDPDLPIEPGEMSDVIVHLKPERVGDRPTLLLKHFMEWTDECLVLAEFNPQQLLYVPLSRVAEVHVIYDTILGPRPARQEQDITIFQGYPIVLP